MTMRRSRVLVIAGLVIALGLVLVWQERRTAAAAVREQAKAERETAGERAGRLWLEMRLDAATRELEAGQRELAQLKAVAPAKAANATEPPAMPSEPRRDPFERVVRSDPTLIALRLARERARLATDYAAFFRERGLTLLRADRAVSGNHERLRGSDGGHCRYRREPEPERGGSAHRAHAAGGV